MQALYFGVHMAVQFYKVSVKHKETMDDLVNMFQIVISKDLFSPT